MNQQSTDIICQLIENTRRHYNIPANKLTRGICNRSYFSRAMSGEREIDKFMVDTLIQRLGKNTRNFEYALDLTEYELFTGRQRLRSAITDGDCRLAQRLAEEYIARQQNTATDRLHIQFGLFMKTYIMKQEEASWEEQYGMAKRALAVTLPDYGEIPVTELYLSETELLLLFRMAWLKGRMGDEEAMAGELKKLYGLLEHERYSDNEQIYIFAAVIYHLARHHLRMGDYYTAGKMAAEGIGRLRVKNKFHYAAELFLIKAMADCRSEDMDYLAEHAGENVFYNYYLVFDSIIKENFPEWDGDTHYPMYYEYNVISVSHIVKQRRRLWGITQERLSEEGFCNLATIESMEGNRRDTQMPIIRRILNVVKLSSQKCYSDIITNDYEVKQEYQRIKIIADQGNPKEALCELERLKPKLDMTFLANRQSVEYLEYIFSCKIYKPEPEEQLESLLKILDYTIPSACWMELDGIFLYNIEKQILRNIIICYERISEENTGIPVLEKLIKGHEEGCEYIQYYSSIALMLESRLANMGKFKEASRLLEKCLRDSVLHNLSGVLAKSLLDKTWNTEQTGKENKKENKKGNMPHGYMQAYALNMYRGNTVLGEAIKKYCRDKYPAASGFNLPGGL